MKNGFGMKSLFDDYVNNNEKKNKKYMNVNK